MGWGTEVPLLLQGLPKPRGVTPRGRIPHCCHLQRHLSGPVGQPVNLLRSRYYGSILFRPHQIDTLGIEPIPAMNPEPTEGPVINSGYVYLVEASGTAPECPLAIETTSNQTVCDAMNLVCCLVTINSTYLAGFDLNVNRVILISRK